MLGRTEACSLCLAIGCFSAKSAKTPANSRRLEGQANEHSSRQSAFWRRQTLKRLEDQRLLTGKGHFIDDKPEDGALWLYVLRSPHAHAKILSIDTADAAKMPGVAAIYTGADLIKDNIGSLPTLDIFKRPDGSPMTVPPRRLLAHEVVRYAGEAVAAVVAKSRVEAQTAAEAIVVDYEVLPSVVDPLEAVKTGAPVVWPAAPDNIVAAMSYGDAKKVEDVFAKAKHVVSLDLVSQRLAPSAMEPRSTIAEVEKGTGRLLLHTQSQTPGSTRDLLAGAILKRPTGQRARAGRRHRRRLWPEDQPLSGRRHRRLCRDQTEQEDPLARRPHRRIRRRHPWPRPHLDRRVRARREGPRAGLSRALDRRDRRLFVRHRQHHPAGARARSCRPASTIFRWCITKSRR